jgi:YVTN family beta-propeller protein
MHKTSILTCLFLVAALSAATAADSLTASRPSAPAVTGARVVTGTVSVTFSAHEPGVPAARLRFRCAFDTTRLHLCPRKYRVRLAVGAHVLRARTVDPRGRQSATTTAHVTVKPPPAPSVAVGLQPVNLAFGAGSVWVTNLGGGSVSRIDVATRKVTATIAVAGQPSGAAFGDGSIWIGNFGNGSVTRIDPATNKVVARIDVGGQPLGPAVASDGTVWVANFDGSVERIDPATNGVTARIPVGGQVDVVAVGFGKVWAGNQDGTVTAIDAATNRVTGIRTLVDQDTDALAVSDNAVWISTFYSGTVAALDPASGAIEKKLRLPGEASGLLFAAGSLWASVYDRSEVVQIDPQTAKIVRTVDVGAKPRDLAFDGSVIWVVNEASNSASRIEP